MFGVSVRRTPIGVGLPMAGARGEGGRMSRKRYTQAERLEVLERLAASGSSAREFCRREGLNYQSLLRWRQRHAAGSAAEGDRLEDDDAREHSRAVFLEVDLERPAARREADIELEIAGGIMVRIWKPGQSR